MKKILSIVFLLVFLAQTAGIAVPKYGQCGGVGYPGSTICDDGLMCLVINQYYSQCQASESNDCTEYCETGGCGSLTCTITIISSGLSISKSISAPPGSYACCWTTGAPANAVHAAALPNTCCP